MRLRAALERFLSPGYSTCLRCRRPWRFVEGHVTAYGPPEAAMRLFDPRTNTWRRSFSRGCFPLCEGCWHELPDGEARWPYYELLIAKWQKPVDADDYIDLYRELFLESALDAMHAEKAITDRTLWT